MKRYFVCRAYIKYKGKLYRKGDLLPDSFTHHDKARSIYNSRIGECDVPATPVEQSAKKSEPITVPLTGTVPAADTKTPESVKLSKKGNSSGKFNLNTTGTKK